MGDRLRLRLCRIGIGLSLLVLAIVNCSSQEADNFDKPTLYYYPKRPAPSFSLEDLEGRKVASRAFKGKITILNFWTTWCGFCRLEIPHLNKLYAAYKDAGVEIVGISFDEGGAQDVIPFMKKVNMDYPILLGTQKVAAAFGGIIGFPTTIVIDRKWQIYQTYPGYVDKSVLERDIKRLLAQD